MFPLRSISVNWMKNLYKLDIEEDNEGVNCEEDEEDFSPVV